MKIKLNCQLTKLYSKELKNDESYERGSRVLVIDVVDETGTKHREFIAISVDILKELNLAI